MFSTPPLFFTRVCINASYLPSQPQFFSVLFFSVNLNTVFSL